MAGFLPGCVWANAKDLHSYQRIHNGPLFGLVLFGELLTTDDLQQFLLSPAPLQLSRSREREEKGEMPNLTL